MAIRSQEDMVGSTGIIRQRLADNNAGAISAADVRESMVDIVDSIIQIVASGQLDSQYPFIGSNLRIAITNGQYGAIEPESGVLFPYEDGNGNRRQLFPYSGPSGIDHNSLANIGVGDPHTQYLKSDGSRTMTGNLGLDNFWINSSGGSNNYDDRGLKFQYVNSSVEHIHIGSGNAQSSGTKFIFDADNSTFNTAKGIAKAWLNFDATTNPPTINSFYNIHQLEKISTGKYRVVFTSGTFGDNYYTAIGSSNARSASDSAEDFSVNKVGLVQRSGDDSIALRSVTFTVLEDDVSPGTYTDAKINELVVFGRGPNEGSGIHPTISVL